MKRSQIIGVCLLVLCLFLMCVCPASASSPKDTARTLEWKNGKLTSPDQTAAFWEYPQITAGQTRRSGRLTLINRSVSEVTIRLDNVQLPYDDDAALTYLGALRLTIRDGDRVLYDGIYSRIHDGLTDAITLRGGETRVLGIALSCDFAYEGDAVCRQVLYWNWQAASSLPSWAQPVLDTWMYWAPALLLLIVLLIVWTVWSRKRHDRLPPAAPTPAATPETPPISEARRAPTHAAPRHVRKK